MVARIVKFKPKSFLSRWVPGISGAECEVGPVFKEELEDGAVAAVGRHQGGRNGGGVGGPVGVDLALFEENLGQFEKSLVAAPLEQCVTAWEAPERKLATFQVRW